MTSVEDRLAFFSRGFERPSHGLQPPVCRMCNQPFCGYNASSYTPYYLVLRMVKYTDSNRDTVSRPILKEKEKFIYIYTNITRWRV